MHTTQRSPKPRCVAFADDRRLADGSVLEVALALNDHFSHTSSATDARILVFDAETSRPVELNIAGTPEEVASRYEIAERRAREALEAASGEVQQTGEAQQADDKPRRGRPKLGVVGREVTLLPRHWQWLSKQPGSASVTLRKLVDQARRQGAAADRKREAQEAAYRFMLAISGDRPGYEEALRALYAGRRQDFEKTIEPWPADVRDHTSTLAAPAFETTGTPESETRETEARGTEPA